MKTTIDIPTPIFDELKRMQQQDGGTLGELVTGLLAEGIESRRRGRSDPAFTWISQPMRARVDLTDKDALAAPPVRLTPAADPRSRNAATRTDVSTPIIDAGDGGTARRRHEGRLRE